jgi:hypothetical protein
MRGMKKVLSLAGILSLTCCTSTNFGLPTNFSEFMFSKESLQEEVLPQPSDAIALVPSIESVAFQNFNPEPYKGEILLDPLYEQYLTGKNDLEGIVNSTNFLATIGNAIYPRTYFPFNQIFKTPDSIQFKDTKVIQEVFEIAVTLGYDKEQIKQLSIHDAILLSGLIAAQKIKSPSQEEENNQQFLNQLYMSSTDNIFQGGIGVCGQYAEINIAIFKLFKTVNPNLRNTVMKYKVGEQPQTKEIHAWNEIITPIYDNSIKFLHTAVDVVQLRAVQKNDSQDRKSQMFNGMGQNHYFIDLYYVSSEKAQLYEKLGSVSRSPLVEGRKYYLQEDLHNPYLELAFKERLKTCMAIIGILNESSRSKLEIMTTVRSEAYIAQLLATQMNVYDKQELYQMHEPKMYEKFSSELNKSLILLIEDMTKKSSFQILHFQDNKSMHCEDFKMAEIEKIFQYARDKKLLNNNAIRIYEIVKKVYAR